jgi:MFS family permease
MSKKEAKKTVRIFAIASFLNDLGSDMIYPIWPLFVTNVLKANMASLGLIDGLGEAVVSLSQAVSGYISDRIKRRKVFIWTGYLFGASSRIGYALSSVWQHLIPFRVLDRTGKMRGAPRDAMIADVSTIKNRGRNFGFLRTMDNFGAVVGILICIFLIRLINYRAIFLLAALPSVVGALLISLLIKEKNWLELNFLKAFL